MSPQGKTKAGFYSVITVSRRGPAGLVELEDQGSEKNILKLQSDCGPFSMSAHKESLSRKATQAEETRRGRGSVVGKHVGKQVSVYQGKYEVKAVQIPTDNLALQHGGGGHYRYVLNCVQAGFKVFVLHLSISFSDEYSLHLYANICTFCFFQ